MKEVSSKVFLLFMKPLKAKGVPLETMVQGTALTVASLLDKNARIDWSDTCAIMRNLRPHFTDAEYRQLGRSYLQSPGVRFLFVVGRLLLTPMSFYAWMNKPRGTNNQLFNCIKPVHREVSDRECEVDLLVDEGLEICWEFFVITSGNFVEMPRLLGYPAADVTLTPIPRGGRFHIVVHKRTPILTRVKRALTWPFTVRTAARELEAAHETLQERYEQLEAAQVVVDRQATQLRTAHKISQLLQSDLDLDHTVALIADELTADAGFAGVALEVSATMDDVTIAREVRRGAQDGARLHRALVGIGNQAIGALQVFLAPSADAAQGEALLDYLVPSVSMALFNAITFRVVVDYRRALEQRVEARTRDLHIARDELTATVHRLEEVQLDRERLFQNISHEIRTPLVLITLAVDAVLGAYKSQLDERALGNLATVTASAGKLVRLVDELLLLAAGRERELTVHAEPIDLGATIDAVAGGWRLAAQSSGLTMALELPRGVVARADATAVERVVSNLLSNAIKFTPAPGHLAVRVTADDAWITVEVADTGPGIDDDLRARLFGRFEQGAAGQASGKGSGIGLSLVRELVAAHGGEVGARANEAAGTGTIFWFTLPRSSAAPAAAVVVPRLAPTDFGVVTATEAVPERFPARRVSQGVVLLAEDEPGLARAIAEILAEDHTVLVAPDGARALQLAEREPPDLLITDIQMPGMDGLELTRRFLARGGATPAPVLMLTARANAEDRVRGLDHGAVDYLTKPFEPSELRARVRAQLAFRRLNGRMHSAEKLASLGALSAGLAHELRNPANGIVNAVAPLRELLPPALVTAEHPVGQLLDVMAECAEQVAFLSRQLLGFRRTGELELKRVPLREVLDRALANASAALTRIEVRERLEYTGTLRCAPPALTQVLVNLLENAAHAAGAGGWVELASHGDGARLRLEVGDSGPGVPQQLHEKIFEPFFTTKPPGQGTGLGLAISRDLIVRHNGTLDVQVRDGRSVFVIDLPAPVTAAISSPA